MMTHECGGGCGRLTGDDDPAALCQTCRDEETQHESACTLCGGSGGFAGDTCPECGGSGVQS
jgi:hypothetical protein